MSFPDLSDDELCKLIGERIRAARIRAGLTPSDVIEAAGVSKSTYYSYETGTGVFSITFLNRLVTAIGCTLSELFQTNEESEQVVASSRLREMIAELGPTLNELRTASEQVARLMTGVKTIAEAEADPTASHRRARSWEDEIIATRATGKVSRKKP